jgi:hypothetical protein
MNHFIKSFVIRWLIFISPKHYQDAIIGDLLESFDAEHLSDRRHVFIKLLWQAAISTPSILVMRFREAHIKLNQQVVWVMLIIGLSTLVLERFVWGSVVWGLAGSWSIQSVFILRLLYLAVSITPVISLCFLLRMNRQFRRSLYVILAEPIFSFYIMLLCFSYAWFTLLNHFSLDLFTFRLVQLLLAYSGMRLAINTGSKNKSRL